MYFWFCFGMHQECILTEFGMFLVGFSGDLTSVWHWPTTGELECFILKIYIRKLERKQTIPWPNLFLFKSSISLVLDFIFIMYFQLNSFLDSFYYLNVFHTFYTNVHSSFYLPCFVKFATVESSSNLSYFDLLQGVSLCFQVSPSLTPWLVPIIFRARNRLHWNTCECKLQILYSK